MRLGKLMALELNITSQFAICSKDKKRTSRPRAFAINAGRVYLPINRAGETSKNTEQMQIVGHVQLHCDTGLKTPYSQTEIHRSNPILNGARWELDGPYDFAPEKPIGDSDLHTHRTAGARPARHKNENGLEPRKHFRHHRRVPRLIVRDRTRLSLVAEQEIVRAVKLAVGMRNVTTTGANDLVDCFSLQ